MASSNDGYPDLRYTSLLLLDFQNDVLDRNLGPDDRRHLIERVGNVLAAARRAGLMVIHVVAQFRPGYPEVSPRDLWRRDIAESGRLQEGTPGAAIVTDLAPTTSEITVVKRRTGAFSTTDLTAVLGARDIRRLVLAGVATGGSVLSTVRAAADLDFDVVVLGDGCADPDGEVHRILCGKVFPRQATVLTTEEFIEASGWNHASA